MHKLKPTQFIHDTREFDSVAFINHDGLCVGDEFGDVSQLHFLGGIIVLMHSIIIVLIITSLILRFLAQYFTFQN